MTNYDHSWSQSSEVGFCRFRRQVQLVYFVEGPGMQICLRAKNVIRYKCCDWQKLDHVEDKYKINDNFASRTVWDNRVSCLHGYK